MRLRIVCAYIGALLSVLGLLMLIPVGIGRIYGEPFSGLYGFIYAFLVSIIGGGILAKAGSLKKPTITESMVICSLGWVLASAVGAIPYYFYGIPYLDAYFESMAGFTTTGITMMMGLQAYPHSLMFWRSFSQWLGGLGIITFFIAVVVEAGGTMFRLYSAEAAKVGTRRAVPGIASVIKELWQVYIALTLLEMIVLKALGLKFFDAFTHSLTTLSTGGFSTYDASIAAFNSPLVEGTIVVFMFLGGANFLLLYGLFRKDFKSLIGNYEFKIYCLIIALFMLLVGSDLFFSIGYSLKDAFRYSAFQVVSVATTTGYITMDFALFPEFSKMLLMVLMLFGGSVGSTAGGFKLFRVAILFGLVRREIKKVRMPRMAVSPVVLNRKPVLPTEVSKTTALFFTYITLVLIGTLLTLIATSYDPTVSASGMLSAVGNVGPFFLSPGEIPALPVLVKLTYIFGMLAGRLEIIPLLMLISPGAWKHFPSD